MDFQDRRYIIGIDLGTTNSAVSYVDMAGMDGKNPAGKIKIFKIPQLTGPGEVSDLSALPSFLYIPGPYDISPESLGHPWKREKDIFAGFFAREHGARLPSRLVSSAKSWLCHARADRQAPILPWGSQDIDKISPVDATAEYLRHIRKAWNHSVKDEDLFLENQYTVITVPASFDEAAREFTLEAARSAGFGKNLTLLEEPLAAFYAWLIRHEHDWHEHVKPRELILVCDVGGGTTDFTLITMTESQGSPGFERLAVGDHLILGGDNIDLALARYVESKFPKKEHLTPDRWKTLAYKCRAAKEKLLENIGTDDGEKVRITLKGEGRSLIAGTLAADLTFGELKKLLCQGFFPHTHPIGTGKGIEKTPGKAITEFGLPYEQEPSITRHIGWFLEKHRGDIKSLLGREPMPDLVLFNGGSLKPDFIQESIRQSIRSWFGDTDSELPRLLENREPDLSVALGASYYGLVKLGAGVRVGSGSPRSYYIGIDASPDRSAAPSRALCIVERGLDEGSVINLPEMEFEVLTNQPVAFNMYSSSFRSGDRSGDIVHVDDSLTLMSPLKTVVKFGRKGESGRIPVLIEPEYTEMGTLALWCRSSATPHRWKLQFQLREPVAGEARESEVYDQEVVEKVGLCITEVFSDSGTSPRLPSLARSIEAVVDAGKNRWPLSFLRSVADYLMDNAPQREMSPEHELRWLNLTGFSMRPGFGDAFDENRMRRLWKIYLKGCLFPKSKQNTLEWWIFCRRIAGGLTAGQQRQFFQDISPRLLSDSGNRQKSSIQEITEMWMAAANMERLLVKDKVTLARKLLPLLKPGKTPRQLMWVLSRIGSRELLYGSVDRVVPAREVETWVKKLQKGRWHPEDGVGPAVARILRKTGDRTRDVARETIDGLLPWLDEIGLPRESLKMLREVVPMESLEESAMFGETLPQGLVLRS
ncbi:MAG: hsp70 family protein [Desulfamplus sp.]|nr:hsp70 family protein [Desulfamplus sp.]